MTEFRHGRRYLGFWSKESAVGCEGEEEEEKEQKEKEKERVRRWYEEVGQPKRAKDRAALKFRQMAEWAGMQMRLEGVEAFDIPP